MERARQEVWVEVWGQEAVEETALVGVEVLADPLVEGVGEVVEEAEGATH